MRSRSISMGLGLCLGIFLLGSIAVPVFGATKINIAMILWRGVTNAEAGFQAGLRESTDYNYNFSILDADRDKDKLNKIFDSLDQTKYNLIYTFGTTVTKLAKSKIKKKPIVFNIVARPIKAGIIDSWEHSGSNVTGASNAVPMASAFRTISRVMYIKRLGFIYNENEANSLIQREEIYRFQEKFGYQMIDSPIVTVEKIEEAIQVVLDGRVDAVLLPSDSLVKANAETIIPLLNQHKIPTIVSIPGMVKDNEAFLGLGPDYFALGKLAANNALQILGGAKPNDVPSKTLERLHLTVNLRTAKKIGQNIPVQILRISTVIR